MNGNINKSHRVIMLTTSFAPEPPGGAEKQLEYLSNYLCSQNIHVTVLTRHLKGFLWKEIKDGYAIIRLPYFGPGKIKSLTFLFSLVFWILLHRKAFDILHAHLVYSPAIAAVVAGKLTGKKTIVRFRSSGKGSELLKSKKNLTGILRMAILKRWADCFIVLTKEMNQELIEAGYDQSRISSMENGVDTDLFSPFVDISKRKKIKNMLLPIVSEKLVLIYTGRFERSKNLPMMLSAFKEALREYPDIHLILLGEGEEKDNLHLITEYLEIQDSVTFLSPVNNVRDYLRIADIFILSSLDEGISNSLLEAMSCGLACISTDVGGARDIFDNGQYGVLVESENVKEMSAAILRLVLSTSARNRFQNLARKRIIEDYSIKNVGRKYVSLYNKILSSGDFL